MAKYVNGRPVKLNRLPYKSKLLDDYVKANRYLKREDMEKMGYNSLDYALYKYSKKTGTGIVKRSYSLWEKTDVGADTEALKVFVNKVYGKVPMTKDEKSALLGIWKSNEDMVGKFCADNPHRSPLWAKQKIAMMRKQGK